MNIETKKQKPKYESLLDDPDYISFMEIQERYDRFYDYVGQETYDWIKAGNKMSEDMKNFWSCTDEEDFLNIWRGNSDEEYKKWLKENGYEEE